VPRRPWQRRLQGAAPLVRERRKKFARPIPAGHAGPATGRSIALVMVVMICREDAADVADVADSFDFFFPPQILWG